MQCYCVCAKDDKMCVYIVVKDFAVSPFFVLHPSFMRMHFSIPDTQELSNENGSTFTVWLFVDKEACFLHNVYVLGL